MVLETAAPAVVSDGSDLLVALVSYPYLGGFLIVAVVVWSWKQQLFEHRRGRCLWLLQASDRLLGQSKARLIEVQGLPMVEPLRNPLPALWVGVLRHWT